MNEKLRAKDLINAGLFTVLYFVLGCCVAIPIGFVPIFLPILGSLWTLITGIPFMLFAVRARKFGMVTLMAILSGLLMGFTGMGFWGVPLGVVFGLLGDRIMKSGQYQSWRKTLLGYGVFQLSGGEKQKIACAGAFLMEPPGLRTGRALRQLGRRRRSGASGRPQDIKSPGKDRDPLGAPALLPPWPC